MATKKEPSANQSTTTEVTEKPKEKPVTSPYITKYRIAELADAAKAAFGTDKVLVLAALRSAGKEAYSMDEARDIISKFKNKEVTK